MSVASISGARGTHARLTQFGRAASPRPLSAREPRCVNERTMGHEPRKCAILSGVEKTTRLILYGVAAPRLFTGATDVPSAANATRHRLALVFHGGDCVLVEEV